MSRTLLLLSLTQIKGMCAQWSNLNILVAYGKSTNVGTLTHSLSSLSLQARHHPSVPGHPQI